MASIDIDAVGDLLIQTGREIIMPRFRRLRDDEVREKSRADLVTIADEEAEAFLTPRLEALLPGSRTVARRRSAPIRPCSDCSASRAITG